MIFDVHPRSCFQGSKKHQIPDPGSGSSTLSLGHHSFLFLEYLLHFTISTVLLCNTFKTKIGCPSGQMSSLCDISCNALTLALALLCARASLSRSFSYLSWASPPPPPSGGFGAGPFSTPPSFFGLSEPENKHKFYKECGSRRCY
jgi:hypothetical protein